MVPVANPDNELDTKKARRWRAFDCRLTAAGLPAAVPEDLVFDRQVFGRRLAITAGFEVERDLLAFTQGRKTGAFDGGDVHECILAAVRRFDEAVTLGRVEPFNSTSSHCRFPLTVGMNRAHTVRGCSVTFTLSGDLVAYRRAGVS